MADPKFYENSPDEIAEWQKLLGKAKKDLEENEAIWLEATEALDGVEV